MLKQNDVILEHAGFNRPCDFDNGFQEEIASYLHVNISLCFQRCSFLYLKFNS